MTRAGLLRSLKDGGALLFQFLPGQLNMRAQLVLSTVYLGAETTALFIYAKQVVTASTQIIAFVLRVDFPGVVEKMAGSREHSFRSILNAQRTTLYCAVTFTVGAMIVSSIAGIVPDFRLHGAATILVAFAPTILTLSLSLMMIQALAALGAYAVIARAAAISSAMGILASYMFITMLNVYAFVLGEVTIHLVGLYIVYRHIRLRYRRRAWPASIG
jgi:O-antigen/teichoic acid export membrane protein